MATGTAAQAAGSATREEQKLKLRLHYGGVFNKARETGEWRYEGGSVYNDAIPLHIAYTDLVQRLNLKLNDAVSLKYLAPGDKLDPDDLVIVQDDDDLEALRDEYVTALAQAGAPSKTFRIQLFASPALQTGLEAVDDLQASECDQQDGPDYDCWDDPEASGVPCDTGIPAVSPGACPHGAGQVSSTWLKPAAASYATASGWPHGPAEPVPAQLGNGHSRLHEHDTWLLPSGSTAQVADGSAWMHAAPGRLRSAQSLSTLLPSGVFGSVAHTAAWPACRRSAPAQHCSTADMPVDAVPGYEEPCLQWPADANSHAQLDDMAQGDTDMAEQAEYWQQQEQQVLINLRHSLHTHDLAHTATMHNAQFVPAVPAPAASWQLQPQPRAERGTPAATATALHPGAPGDPGPRGLHALREDDFSVDDMDPYNEPDDSSPRGRTASRLPPLMGRTSERPGQAHTPAAPPAGSCTPEQQAPGTGNTAAGGAMFPDDMQHQHLGALSTPDDHTHEAGMRRTGGSLYKKPLDRVRDPATRLPSHISAFGDSGGGTPSRNSSPGAPPARVSPGGPGAVLRIPALARVAATAARDEGQAGGEGTSLRLPSHISEFGEGGKWERTADAGADEAPQAPPGPCDAPGKGYSQGRLITQEFRRAGDSLPAEGVMDGHVPQLDYSNFNSAPVPEVVTPKALLESVPHVPRANVKITAKIGEGAFGDVSRAEVFPYGSLAIKWLKRDRFAKYSESFQREAEVLAKLNHPNIIRMYGLITEPNDLPVRTPSLSSSSHGSGNGRGPNGGCAGTYLALPQAHPNGSSGTSMAATDHIAGIMMEYVRGGSLAQRFRTMASQGGKLPLRQRCRIAHQAALGMSYLHDQQPAVIHFDLKPDNLLVEGDGEDVLVKVADFGLSKHKFQSYVTCHDLRGTLPYMAPELVANPTKVCEKCDVWSMGVVMWEMLTLEVPFQELTAQQILMGLMNGSLNLRMPPDAEREWVTLIGQCMEIAPAGRISFKELATELEQLGEQLDLQQQQAAAVLHAQQQAQQHAHHYHQMQQQLAQLAAQQQAVQQQQLYQQLQPALLNHQAHAAQAQLQLELSHMQGLHLLAHADTLSPHQPLAHHQIHMAATMSGAVNGPLAMHPHLQPAPSRLQLLAAAGFSQTPLMNHLTQQDLLALASTMPTALANQLPSNLLLAHHVR